jgi:hypothetical protein
MGIEGRGKKVINMYPTVQIIQDVTSPLPPPKPESPFFLPLNSSHSTFHKHVIDITSSDDSLPPLDSHNTGHSNETQTEIEIGTETETKTQQFSTNTNTSTTTTTFTNKDNESNGNNDNNRESNKRKLDGLSGMGTEYESEPKIAKSEFDVDADADELQDTQQESSRDIGEVTKPSLYLLFIFFHIFSLHRTIHDTKRFNKDNTIDIDSMDDEAGIEQMGNKFSKKELVAQKGLWLTTSYYNK